MLTMVGDVVARGRPHQEQLQYQMLLDDLSWVIDVSLLIAFATAIHLLRRGRIAVATLAHALSVIFLVVAVGHFIEAHMMGGFDGVETLVKRHYRRPGRNMFAEWSKAAVVSTTAVCVLVARFWTCNGVGIDCVVGEHASIHYPCKILRFMFYGPVFLATVGFVYVCVSARLNAVLGGSVLHPQGGGRAVAVLTTPTLMSAICISGCLSVWLYSVFVRAQGIDVSQHSSRTHGFHKPQHDSHFVQSLQNQSVSHGSTPSPGSGGGRARALGSHSTNECGGVHLSGINSGPSAMLGSTRASQSAFCPAQINVTHGIGVRQAAGGLAGRESTLWRGRVKLGWDKGGGSGKEGSYTRGVDGSLEDVPSLSLPYPGGRRIGGDPTTAMMSPQVQGVSSRRGGSIRGSSYEREKGARSPSCAALLDGRLDGMDTAAATAGTRSVFSDSHLSTWARSEYVSVDDLALIPRAHRRGARQQPHQSLQQGLGSQENSSTDGDGVNGGGKGIGYIGKKSDSRAIAASVTRANVSAAADGWTSTASSSSSRSSGDDVRHKSKHSATSRTRSGGGSRIADGIADTRRNGYTGQNEGRDILKWSLDPNKEASTSSGSDGQEYREVRLHGLHLPFRHHGQQRTVPETPLLPRPTSGRLPAYTRRNTTRDDDRRSSNSSGEDYNGTVGVAVTRPAESSSRASLEAAASRTSARQRSVRKIVSGTDPSYIGREQRAHMPMGGGDALPGVGLTHDSRGKHRQWRNENRRTGFESPTILGVSLSGHHDDGGIRPGLHRRHVYGGESTGHRLDMKLGESPRLLENS